MLHRKRKSFANETEANKIFNDAAPNSKRMLQLAGHVVESFEGSSRPNHHPLLYMDVQLLS